MASFAVKWYGAEITLDDQETRNIITQLNQAAGATNIFGIISTAAGAGMPVGLIASVSAAIVSLGAVKLGGCNNPGRGIVVTFLWVGLPFCKSR